LRVVGIERIEIKQKDTMNVILTAATAPAIGAAIYPKSADRVFQATVTGTGSVGATVIIEGSANDTDYLPLGTITLSGTGSATGGFPSAAKWLSVRAHLTTISGTGAAITVVMGD
jgi:hypothetical protein